MTDDVGVVLKFPTFHEMVNTEQEDNGSVAQIFDMLTKCIDYVYDKENVYNEFTEDEVKAWIDTLNQSQFEKISTFFTEMPSLKHEVTWKCGGCDEEDSIEIEGLNNFFT